MKVFLISFHYENKFCLPFSLPKYLDDDNLISSLRDFLDQLVSTRNQVQTTREILESLKDSYFSVFGVFDVHNGFNPFERIINFRDVVDDEFLSKFDFLGVEL